MSTGTSENPGRSENPARTANTVLDEVLVANEAFADTFQSGMLPAPPARHLAVVTCMDARILPLGVFGLEPGDAHIIRNAGGRVSDDVVRSLLVSVHVLGVREVAVVHHTECGMARYSDAELQAAVEQATGQPAADIDFQAIDDVEQAMHDDLELIRSSPLFPPDVEVRGYEYDVRTGRLREMR
jgi:carbonic anhydrase